MAKDSYNQLMFEVTMCILFVYTRFLGVFAMASQIITKWGNSLGIRIPRSIAKQINLEEGTAVTFTVSEGNLILKPQKRKKYTLNELLEGMTSDNFHEEVDMGVPVGNEIW